jgi:hypothetical protein
VSRQSGCDLKRRFLTRRDAKRVANRLRSEGVATMRPYLCPDCALFHIGHPPGRGTGLRRDRTNPGGFRRVGVPREYGGEAS